jgi:hypothetical protein
MSNPLLDKFEELYGSPEVETTKETTEDIGRQKMKEVVTRAMRSGFVSRDLDSIKESFLQTADKVAENQAKVTDMTMNVENGKFTIINFTVHFL